MKPMTSAALACAYLGMLATFAQEPAPSDEPVAPEERSAATPAATERESVETETRELTRAERRELRRSERAAREAAEAAEAAEQAAAAADEGIICRRESTVGTHQRVRICTTRAEREAAREAAQEVLRDTSRSQGVLATEGN